MKATPGTVGRVPNFCHAYLSLGALGREFVLPVSDSYSFVSIETLTRVPLSPPYVLGLFSIRADIVPVISLALRLEPGAIAPGGPSMAVVMKFGDEFCALAVDELGGLIYGRDEDLVAFPSQLDCRNDELTLGALRHGRALVPILDIAAICDFPRGGAAAPSQSHKQRQET